MIYYCLNMLALILIFLFFLGDIMQDKMYKLVYKWTWDAEKRLGPGSKEV